MATNHEFREDDTFDVVEALYHEAEMMLTQEERSASLPNQEPPSKKSDVKKSFNHESRAKKKRQCQYLLAFQTFTKRLRL